MLLKCALYRPVWSLTCLECSRNIMSVSVSDCWVYKIQSPDTRELSVDKIQSARGYGTATTTPKHLKFSGIRTVPAPSKSASFTFLSSRQHFNKWTKSTSSAGPILDFQTRILKKFSHRKYGTGNNYDSPVNKNISNEIVDAEVKDWLSELRTDFRNEISTTKHAAHLQNRQAVSETEYVEGDNNVTSSSSDSDTDCESSSDTELDDLKNTEMIIESAEFYADGHMISSKGKPKVLRQRVSGSTDIDEHTELWADVSEYAKKIKENDNLTSYDLGASSDWSKSTITIEEFPDYESDEEEEEKPHYVPPIPLTRGVEGVFDIDDLMTLLNVDNALDCCVIKVPKEHHYVDYLVLVTAKSPRHNNGMAEDVQWIYKRKKGKKDPTLKIEKGDNWTAMDLGNIALHMFLPEAREMYDIETLWTCGEAFDEKSLESDADQYAFLMPPIIETPGEITPNDRNIDRDENGEKL